MLFSYTLAATTALTVANAAVIGKRALSGEATVYGGNLAGGTCSFSTYTLPAGIFGTALTDSSWDNSANCGRCVSVTGPTGKKITAMVSSIKLMGNRNLHLLGGGSMPRMRDKPP
jgi:hypothetical protein